MPALIAAQLTPLIFNNEFQKTILIIMCVLWLLIVAMPMRVQVLPGNQEYFTVKKYYLRRDL
jgi:hypothetical protein